MGPTGPHGCRPALAISELSKFHNTTTKMAWAILFRNIIVCTIECWHTVVGLSPFCYYCEFPTQVYGIDRAGIAFSGSLALRVQLLLDKVRVFGLGIVGSFLARLAMNF